MLSRISLAAALAAFMIGGCASKGNDQNYRLLEEDHERFETEPHSSREISIAYGQLSNDTLVNTRSNRRPREEARVFEVEEPATTIRTSEPSLRGVDRSHWGTVDVRPQEHVLTVQPHYFEDYTTYAARPGHPTVPLRSDEQAMATLGPAEADNLSARNLFNLVGQPVELAFDLALFPVRLVLTPPWTNVGPETRGHGTTYFEGSTREPVPAETYPTGVRTNAVKGTVDIVEPTETVKMELDEVSTEADDDVMLDVNEVEPEANMVEPTLDDEMEAEPTPAPAGEDVMIEPAEEDPAAME